MLNQGYDDPLVVTAITFESTPISPPELLRKVREILNRHVD